ncbi:MAG: cupin domain-containing protein [Anaerolineales bacterium]
MSSYTFLSNLADEIPDIPADSIISRTIYTDEQVKAVLFGFAPGQELSEHTAATPAILYFVSGEASLQLEAERMEARPGTYVHMQANQPHSIKAETYTVMLLLLLRSS